MQFDANGLALEFKDLINFTLADKYGPEIKDNIERYKKRRDEFLTMEDPKDAYKEVIKTKLTNGFYREISDIRKPDFDGDFDSFYYTYQNDPRTEAINKLTDITINYSSFPITQPNAKKWVNKLFRYKNLKDFTENLYIQRKNGEKSEILGDKGADHYLRGVGYFDIIPIDLHERRFLIRTGIWHLFNVKNQDPTDIRSLQDALNQFSLHYLKGKLMEGIDLGVSPGIVDLLLWSFCSDQRYNICGKVPKCSGCKLEKTCFLGISNTERDINKQRIIVYSPKVLGANKLQKHYLEVKVTERQQDINHHPVIPKDRVNFFPAHGQVFELDLPTGATLSALMGKGSTQHTHLHSRLRGRIQAWWEQAQPKVGNTLVFEEVVPKSQYKVTIIRS
jgi:hypothetical protein